MIKRVKTIREIYDEVRDFDLVITNDAPLATALNKLVESPRLGYLAMTPKQIASKFAQIYFGKIYEKYEVILKISKSAGRPVRLIHRICSRIYEIWMYNAKLEFAAQYLNEDELFILNLISEFDTIESVMENFNEDFYGNKKIAVAGEELFSLLDMEVLPRRGQPAERINLFTGEEFRIDRTYLFGSAGDLIDNVMKLVNRDNADETAVVLNQESKYLELLKARFRDEGIDVDIKNLLKDELSVRNFISLAELSLRINDLYVREFLPLASEFGFGISYEFNHFDLNAYMKTFNTDTGLSGFFDLCRSVVRMKYGELLKELSDKFGFKTVPEFFELLELLELANADINENNLIELKYFIKEFDIELNSGKTGVLFVNSLNSAFADRQNVFFIGIDNSWMRIFPDKDYLNKEEEEIKNLERFQILIQQGKNRFYFVQNVVDFSEVLPCYYFRILSENNKIESFSDEYFGPVYINSGKKSFEYKGRQKKLPAEKEKEIYAVSPTNFNRYFKCPKLYSFNLLTPDEKIPAFRKGSLFHNFAELYFNHPEFTIENIKSILDKMTDEMSVLEKNTAREYLLSQFRIGTESIIKFLGENNFPKTKLNAPVRQDENILMKFFDKEKIYNNTENWLTDAESTMIRGRIDLQSENTIVDYKSTGYKKSESAITLQSNLDYIRKEESEDFDFQAIAYIAALRGKYKEINFIYNFLFADYIHQINSETDSKSTVSKIKYLPLTFTEYLYSDECFDFLINDKKFNKLFEVLGRDRYNYIIDNLNPEDAEYFEKDLLIKKVIDITINLVAELDMSYKDFNCKKPETFIKNIVEPFAKALYKIRTGNTGTGMLFRDDADSFNELLKEKIKEINENMNSSFPYEPVFGSRDICKKCGFLNLCMGNRLWH